MFGDMQLKEPPRNGRYKYERLRERLREAIRTRELSGKLPGERELARRYNANAKTINKALADLSIEGLLVRHVGRGTFVAEETPHGSAAPARVRTFGCLVPQAGALECRRHLQDLLQDSVGRAGHRLLPVQAATDASGRVTARGITPGHLRGWDGAVLLCGCPSDDLVADLHRRHLPLVLISNCHDRIKALTVLPDYSQGVFELAQHMIQLGHHRLQVLIDETLYPAAASAAMGYRAAMQRYGLRPVEAVRANASLDWARLLGAPDRATGLVCVGGGIAIEACRRAADAGLAVPTALSVSCIPDAGDGRMNEHSITTYEIPADAVAYWAAELLVSAAPAQPPRLVIVPGQLKDRGSVAVPPGATARV